MTRMLAVLIALMLLGGGVLAWAAGGPGQDPAPPPASQDVAGLVSLARPITPQAVDTKPPSAIEMAITMPNGRRHVLLGFREQRTRSGRPVDRTCALAGPEKAIRKLTQALGNCIDNASGPPFSVNTASGSDGVISLQGFTTHEVERLTLAGPGGTFQVPRSRSGSFLIVYGPKARGRAVLAARLRDGTTRYLRTELPPTFRPPGVTLVPDSGGKAPWYAQADTQVRGSRSGQTCVTASQDQPLGLGFVLSGRFCGDLRQDPVVARTFTTGREEPGRPLVGRGAPRRTLLAGAASPAVREVAVTGPEGWQVLPLAAQGRAFLAVFPAGTRSSQLSLEVRYVDGRTERFENPVEVNRATFERPPPHVRGRVSLQLRPPGSRQVELRATLDTPARRFEITFNGRPVKMRRIGGSADRPRYRGFYDGTRGKRRDVRPGRRHRFSVKLCGDTCSVDLGGAPLR